MGSSSGSLTAWDPTTRPHQLRMVLVQGERGLEPSPGSAPKSSGSLGQGT